MEFWKLLAGGAVMRSIEESKKKKKAKNSVDLFDEALEIVWDFESFLSSNGFIYCDSGRPTTNELSVISQTQVNDERQRTIYLKKQLSEYLTLGGNPHNVLDVKDIDDYIEKIKYLNSVGYLNKQDELIDYEIDKIKSTIQMYIATDKKKQEQTDKLLNCFNFSAGDLDNLQVHVDDDFYPLNNKMFYEVLEQHLKQDKNNLDYIGNMIGLLQDFIFSDNLYQWDDELSNAEIFKIKKNAAAKVLNIAQNFEDNKLLYCEYSAIMAQNYFVLGLWDHALYYYTELLKQPGIMDKEYNKEFYVGELSLAAKIIHNICVILALMGDINKCDEIMKKYGYIYTLESQMLLRIAQRDPSVSDYVNKSLELMTNFTQNPCIYVDSTLGNIYDPERKSILNAIHEDSINRNNNNIYKPDMNVFLNVTSLGKNVFGLVDTQYGFSDDLIIQIHQVK